MSTLVWRSGTYICTYREEKSIRRSHFVFRALHCLVISPTWSEIWRRLWHLTAMKMFPTIFVIEPSSPRPSCQLLWRGKKGNQWNKVCRLIFIASPYRSNDSRKRRKIKQTIHTLSEQHRQFLRKKVKLNFFFPGWSWRRIDCSFRDDTVWFDGAEEWEDERPKRRGDLFHHTDCGVVYLELLESLSTASDSSMQRLYIVYSSIYLYNFRQSR
jgi:hypothetical protein